MAATVKTTVPATSEAPDIDTKAMEASKKKIVANIAIIAKNGKALQSAIHDTGMQILEHVETYRETSLANQLVNAMPKSLRKNALIAWFQAHGKMKWNQEKKALSFKKEFVTKLEEANEKPFWEFLPEKDFVAYDLQKDIASLIKRAANKSDDDRNKVDPVLLAKLETLVA